MTEQERRDYVKFMNTKENAYQCEKCPENTGASSSLDHRLPCGQCNCWVVCHCR